MKTILVPVGGSDSDASVLATGLMAARALGAHLDFLHLQLGLAAAAAQAPHLDFVRGEALREGMDWLKHEMAARSDAAEHHVRRFCREHRIPLRKTPGRARVWASWSEEEEEDGVEHLVRRARLSDLVVIGRPTRVNGLPADLLELLLLESGRPLLVTPDPAPRHLTGTIMICWRDTAEAARALAAALPLLAKAEHVVVTAVADRLNIRPEAPAEVSRYLASRGIIAEPRWIARNGGSVPESLAASADDCAADLVVMGGYGHSRVRETVFGGCTEHFLEMRKRAVLLVQ